MNDLDSDYETFPVHTRIPDDEILALYVELTVNGEYDLLPYEQQWKARGPLLLENGYRLRKRYDHDWHPSWEDTNLNPFYCEDSIDSSTPNVMDAVRVGDDLPVAIKATLSWTTEAPIAFLFTDGDAVAEPRNHCVPILDTFIDDEEEIVYIVMPLLRAFNDPAFVAVAEIIDFVDQMIQGIEYMHEQGVAHRDITAGNIMMDASELFPEGFHPVRQNLSRNGLTEVVGIMRTHAPVRYYLIDFDNAIAFEKGTPSHLKFAEGKAGRDDEVPEFKIAKPYDPFKVDIFQFGNMLRKELIQKYKGVEFLESLVKDMMRTRPQDRPNSKELRVKFNTVRNRLTAQQIRAHLELKNTGDPLRERLTELGIEGLLESESDDSPEQSSSEAPTTASYWSARNNRLDSSVSSIEQPEEQQQSTFSKITSKLTGRPRSPARTSSSGGTAIPWRPAKESKPRSPSPSPVRSAPQPIPDSHSASSSSTGSPKSGVGYLRTGKFPWSASSSPDSVGGQSPILAVVNHFLAPERLYSEEMFENTYRPPVEERMGWQSSGAPASQFAAPPKAPAPAPAPVPAPAPTQLPARNRRNTVNNAPAPVAAPPAPAPQPSRPSPPLHTQSVGGWGGAGSMFHDFAPEETYTPFPAQPTRSTSSAYGKSNKSTPSIFTPPVQQQQQSSYSTWDAPSAYGGAGEMGMDPEDFSWASEDALKALSQPAPPSKSVSPPPVIAKPMSTAEKKIKGIKSPASTITKKTSPFDLSAASTPVPPSTTSTVRGSLANRLAAATNAGNRKSTIAVEDGTPFNTPPKTMADLPPPAPTPVPAPAPSTSPTAAKIKKTKGKKNSISETPKEKEEKKKEERANDEWSMPAINDASTVKTRKRGGSGASNTSRPNSPLAIFGSRSRSGSKTEPAPKAPLNTKPSTLKASAFGAKSKVSPPAAPAPESEDTGAFSFGVPSFVSNIWGSWGGPEEPPQAKAAPTPAPPKPTAWSRPSDPPPSKTSGWSKPAAPSPPIEPPRSEYETFSPPVPTPPAKAGWKTKNSYFTMDPKPVAASSPQEEEDLAHLMSSMRMSMPPAAEATPRAAFQLANGFTEGPEMDLNFESLGAKSGEDFWSSAMNAFNVQPGAEEEEEEEWREPEPEPVAQPAPAFAKMKGAKGKFEAPPAPEPVKSKLVPPKGKKAAAVKAKATTIAVESATPTPVTEAEDPWNLVTVAKAAPIPKAKEAPKATYDDWGFDGAEEEEEESNEPVTVSAASLEPASPEPDSWFTAKPKANQASKFNKPVAAPAPAPTPAPASAWGTKAAKGRKAWGVEEPPKPQSPPEVSPIADEPNVEEVKDDEWAEPVKKGGKKGRNAEPTKPVNKWSSFNTDKEEEDLAAELDEQVEVPAEDTAAKEAEKEAASKAATKATQAKNNKQGKKKGKR